MSKHKTLGQVYTPDWIVEHILDAVGYNGQKIFDQYILEPSCGDGAFLSEIVKRYIKETKSSRWSKSKIVLGLEEYIHAIELDTIEWSKCISRLDQIVSQELGKVKVKWNVHCMNTLQFYANRQKYYHYIVGNPPYIRIHNIDVRTRSFIKQKFQFTEGTLDIYLTFFEMGLFMLREDGLLGYITPNSFLKNSSYKKFRAYLRDERRIVSIIDFKATKLFEGYSTYTAIMILKGSSNVGDFDYFEYSNRKIRKVNHIDFHSLTNRQWSFSDVKGAKFLNKLEKSKTKEVQDFYQVQYGFATLRDRIYIAKISPTDNSNLVLFNNCLIEKKILMPIIKASKFRGVYDDSHIIFPYRKVDGRYSVLHLKELKADFPYAYRYLISNKTELQNRNLEKGTKWYEFGRSQGIQTMHSEKIVVNTLTKDQVMYFHVAPHIMVYSGIFITKKDADIPWDMIDTILSSKEFYHYICLTGKDLSGGYKSISSKHIKSFGIPNTALERVGL